MTKKLWYHNQLLPIIIILLGIVVRGIALGKMPIGLNQDEAFAGYEAFSLLHYGIDSAGYHNPCYFIAWGSGMNVLESYLAIPFIKILGLSIVSIRLPQFIISCCSLPVFYLLIKDLFGNRPAIIGLTLLTISPWHIMLSRWGLESNLAPAFLLFGFYFFVKGIQKNKYFILSAVMYGLSLYAYSITWLIVPLTIFLMGIYLFKYKTHISVQYLLASVAILFLLALPLIIFLLVNKNIIPEIKTNILSIPNLVRMRDSEIHIKNFCSASSYENFIRVFVNQNDGLIWNSTESFGLYYKFSLPFIILGIVCFFKEIRTKWRSKEFSNQILIGISVVSATLICLLISGLNVNKANSLHYYVLIFLTIGIEQIFRLTEGKAARILCQTVVAGYAVVFICFSAFYFGSYQNQISTEFKAGLDQAIPYAKTVSSNGIYLDSEIFYSQVLFFDQTPTPEYLRTVQYSNYPSAFLKVSKFANYHFDIDYDSLQEDNVYIAPRDQIDAFKNGGFSIAEFENYVVAYK